MAGQITAEHGNQQVAAGCWLPPGRSEAAPHPPQKQRQPQQAILYRFQQILIVRVMHAVTGLRVAIPEAPGPVTQQRGLFYQAQ
ncbi:hypothetical protein D3C80_1686060 [compost metagenome]